MIMHYAFALLPLLAGASAAISVLYPTAGSIWYRNDTVNLNWTQSDPSTDTYLFRAFLSNADSSILSTPQRIADSTNATATFVRIALPQLPAASGYVVRLVNTTDESQVFATSEAFEIQDGEFRNQTSSSAVASQTQSRSTEPLPNANTQSQSAFPSASAARSSGAAAPAHLVSASGLLAQAAGAIGLVAGGAAVLL